MHDTAYSCSFLRTVATVPTAAAGNDGSSAAVIGTGYGEFVKGTFPANPAATTTIGSTNKNNEPQAAMETPLWRPGRLPTTTLRFGMHAGSSDRTSHNGEHF